MPKKKRSTSNATAAKQRRQAGRRASIAESKAKKLEAQWRAAYQRCIDDGGFRVRTAHGSVRDLTLERMRTHTEAALATDGEPPYDDHEEFLSHVWDEFISGWVILHDDGTWSFDEDYFSDLEPKR